MTDHDIIDFERSLQEEKDLRRGFEFCLGQTKTGLDIIDGQFNLRYVDPEWIKVYGDWRGHKCHEYIIMGSDVPCPGCIASNLQFFKGAVDASSNAVRMAHPDGRPFYQNKAFDKLYGQVGEDPGNIYVKKEVGEEVLATIKSGGQWAGEVQMHAADGTVRDIQLRAYAIQDGQGSITALVGVHTDITERKRAKEALRIQNELYMQLVDTHPAGIYRVRIFPPEKWANNAWDNSKNAPYVMELIRDRFCKILGIDKEVYSRNPGILNDLIYPEDKAGFARIHKDTMANPRSFYWEGRIVVDEKIRWVSFESLPQVHENGDVLWTGYVQNITERKRAEDDLATRVRIANAFLTVQEEEMYNEVLKVVLDVLHSPFGMFGYLDEAGALVVPSMTRQVWDKSQVPEKTSRFPRETWSDSSWARAIREKRVVYSNEPANNVLESHVDIQRHISLPILFQREPVALFMVANSAQEYTKADLRTLESIAGNVAPLLVARLGRKRAEEEKEKLQAQFIQSQKMESVGRLAGGMAHDFNNMLGVILGYSELALMKVDLSQKLHSDLEEIHKAAESSADLTRQLLAFARKQTITPRVLDLNQTVAGMLKMLPRILGEDIDLVWKPGNRLWPVKMDPSQIDQMLANLCVNARDAIADTGKITIETQNSAFDEEYCTVHAGFTPGEYVRLSLSDNGCGMDPETLSHLFEPFFTTKEMGKGTGLGLATVYGVVKQNNGFINVYSEPGQGTTFKIYLPRDKTKEESLPEQGPVQPAARGNETILLVEDEPAILKMTTILLEGLGYGVLAASTPDEVLRLAEEHQHPGRIHLLMTDVVMPKMNGRDLAKTLMSLYPDFKQL